MDRVDVAVGYPVSATSNRPDLERCRPAPRWSFIGVGDFTIMSAPECVFCAVATGSLDAHVVWSDERTVAFLDRSPLFKGHVLVVPRRHVVTLVDLADDEIAPLFSTVRRVAGALPRALDAHGTFVANNNIVSQSVAHLHVHVVPRRRKDGMSGFFWPRQRYEDGEAAQIAATIASVLSDS